MSCVLLAGDLRVWEKWVYRVSEFLLHFRVDCNQDLDVKLQYNCNIHRSFGFLRRHDDLGLRDFGMCVRGFTCVCAMIYFFNCSAHTYITYGGRGIDLLLPNFPFHENVF